MSERTWTIESICDALGHPALAQRFLGEINRAPAHELLATFARWQQIAQDCLATVARGRELAAYDGRGEPYPGEWVDRTDHTLTEASRIRTRGAA